MTAGGMGQLAAAIWPTCFTSFPPHPSQLTMGAPPLPLLLLFLLIATIPPHLPHSRWFAMEQIALADSPWGELAACPSSQSACQGVGLCHPLRSGAQTQCRMGWAVVSGARLFQKAVCLVWRSNIVALHRIHHMPRFPVHSFLKKPGIQTAWPTPPSALSDRRPMGRQRFIPRHADLLPGCTNPHTKGRASAFPLDTSNREGVRWSGQWLIVLHGELARAICPVANCQRWATWEEWSGRNACGGLAGAGGGVYSEAGRARQPIVLDLTAEHEVMETWGLPLPNPRSHYRLGNDHNVDLTSSSNTRNK